MNCPAIYDRATITNNTINITTAVTGMNTPAQSGFSACLLFSIAALAPGQKKNSICSITHGMFRGYSAAFMAFA